MAARKNQIKYNVAAFACLFSVSLYRQISLRLWPDDPARTYVLYLCYAALTAAWAVSLHVRVTQRSVRSFLLLEDLVIFAGLTLRFVQDTFWYENIPLMRVSGLYLSAMLLPQALLGFYAVFGIGQADDYRVPKRWGLLAIPVLLLFLAAATDERRHFFFFLLPQEPQPNLNFHPGVGMLLIYVAGLALYAARAVCVYRRNNLMSGRPFMRRAIPCVEPVLLLATTLPYMAVTLNLVPALAGVEVIEIFAKIYYVEVLTWEIYIYLGLIPTNSDYQEIFRKSTAAMQILGGDGTRILSEGAEPIPAPLLAELVRKRCVTTEDGNELCLYPLRDACFIWKNDVSGLNQTIAELNQSAESLAQEGILLDEELRTKNEETSLRLKNQIFDGLTREVSGQLRLMTELTKKRNLPPERDALLRRLFLLGTYVKRRCNLRLVQKETGAVHGDDLRLSLEDMVSAMKFVGIECSLRWSEAPAASAEFSLFVFDTLENLLEWERFQVGRVELAAARDGFSFAFYGVRSGTPQPANPEGHPLCIEPRPDGYLVRLREGGEEDAL